LTLFYLFLSIPVERVIRICDPDAARVPFMFKVGDSVCLKHDPSMVGKISDGQFSGGFPSGCYQIVYEIELEEGLAFLATEMDLEKLPVQAENAHL
jgi:hypothetical protein